MSTQITISPEIKLVINTTPITGGSAGQILFQTTGNTVGESANLFWDNTNGRLGIGTSSPSRTLDIAGNQLITYADVANPDLGPAAFQITNGTFAKFAIINDANRCRVNMLGTSTQGLRIESGANTNISVIGGGGLTLSSTSNNFSISANAFLLNTAGSERMRIPNTGNILINTTTDAGFRLDVNGTARVASTLTVGSPAGSGLINICRTDNAVMTTISSPDVCIINNLNGNGVRINVDSVNYFHVRGFASQFAVNVTGALTSNAGFTRALLVNNVINANANNVELAAVYISPTFNNLAFTGVKNIAIQSASGGAHFNTTSVDVSSILQADSTTKGFLPPRQTQAQRTAIASPAVGLIVYQTDLTEGLYIYKSTGWTFIV